MKDIVRPDIQLMQDDLTEWRRELHQHPETGFEEQYISSFVQEKLKEFGIDFKSGYGETGVVAQIKGKQTTSNKSIALRADMDALDIIEESGKPWSSKHHGKMHGCGHDGHTTMLLAAAKYLKENPDFNGTVNFLFQPAEETLMGARAMLKDGVFKDFPSTEIYGMHNWPWIPRGSFGLRHGSLMAAVSYIEITVTGKAGHSGMINEAIDPVLVGCQIITSLQSLISQRKDPKEPAILYFPIFETNVQDPGVVPEKALLKGILRTFNVGVRAQIEQQVREMSNSIAAAHGAMASVEIVCDSDEVFNHPDQTEFVQGVLIDMVGKEKVDMDTPICMAGEDFGSFVREVPGTFIFIGQMELEKADDSSNFSLHSPYYDFNDDIIPIGVEYWVRLVEQALPLS